MVCQALNDIQKHTQLNGGILEQIKNLKFSQYVNAYHS